MNFDCGIYCITGPSGKRYIGQAVSISARWRMHRSALRAGKHKNKHLQNAWKKYGEGGFVFSKIAFVPSHELNVREQEQIDSYPSSELYNIALEVGFSRRGVKTSDETRAKISAIHKLAYANGRPHPCRGRKLSPEQLARMSDFMKGNVPSAETRAKISAANKGRVMPPDQRQRLSLSKIGKLKGADSPVARPAICVETGQWFASITLAVEWLRKNGKPKADRSCIAKVCKMDGRQNSAYGYTWRYADADSWCGEFKGHLSS